MSLVKDGYSNFGKYKTYYKIVRSTGKKDGKLPVLILNGGPGSPHNYLLNLENLTKFNRPVIFYDQIGCGLSSHPANNDIWVIQLFIDQINALRRDLGLDKLHLFGHSWGGMLAIDYLLNKPDGIKSVVLASTMISIPLFQKEMKKLRHKLPRDIRTTLARHEKAGTTDSSEYKEAYRYFSKTHIYRLDEWPTHLNPAKDSFGTAVYQKMWGPSETYPNGTLKNWDRLNELSQINTPTLIVSGRHDELTPDQAKLTQKLIPKSEIEIFEHSAHMAHIEEPSRFIETLENFFEKVEKHT